MSSLGKKRISTVFIVILGVLILAITSVNADFGTHLNITINEQVYQETTFAENFTLTEWQKLCYSEGTVNVSNQNTETVYDTYISFTNTDLLSTNFTHVASTKWGNQTSGAPGSIIILYIPELRQGNYSVFTYNISCMGINPPLNIETNYANSDHGYNRKVLAGNNWTMNQTVRNDNLINLTITNINISMLVANVTWNNTLHSFYLAGLYSLGDFGNVAGPGVSISKWSWAPSAGSLDWHKNVSIRFNMTAPQSVPFTATYLALRESVTFQVDTLLSNLTLVDINASARADIDFEKRITQPADNAESHNVTYAISPKVTVPVNITYDLNFVTLWVTEDMDPANKTNPSEGTYDWGLIEYNYTGSPIAQINLTTDWNGADWSFNYTDGINSTYPPPIVWMQPEFLISHRYGQIVNYSQSIAGNDTYLKYIYVVHGYWLEIEKNITNYDEDRYLIRIHVENIGNGWTPQYEKVTVYDFVPSEFAAWNMSIACPSSQCTNLSVGSAGDQFYGESFRWDIPWKGTMNSSLGPKNGPNPTGYANYSWNVTYRVNGSGPYRVTELYIVGLDPLKVDGAFASPIITIISGIQTYTNEIIYVSVIVFLIVVNITNLIMTNRIHKKIQDRLPPAPPAR